VSSDDKDIPKGLDSGGINTLLSWEQDE